MKKIILVLCVVIAVSFGVSIVLADTPYPQMAPETVDSAADNLPSVADNIIRSTFKDMPDSITSTDLMRSNGYQINYISLEKLLSNSSRSVSRLLEDREEADYLYYLYSDDSPLILVTMTYDGSAAAMKLMMNFTTADKISIYRYTPMWGDYVLSASINGTTYVLPFDGGQHILEEYSSVTDYRQLPTLNEFIDLLREMYKERKEASEKDIQSGGSGILYGDLLCRPAIH